MRPYRVSGHQSQKEECSVFREGRNLPDSECEDVEINIQDGMNMR